MVEKAFLLLIRNQFVPLAEQNTFDAPTEFLDKTYDAINQSKVL